jgi:hypothetical protein
MSLTPVTSETMIGYCPTGNVYCSYTSYKDGNVNGWRHVIIGDKFVTGYGKSKRDLIESGAVLEPTSTDGVPMEIIEVPWKYPNNTAPPLETENVFIGNLGSIIDEGVKITEFPIEQESTNEEDTSTTQTIHIEMNSTVVTLKTELKSNVFVLLHNNRDLTFRFLDKIKFNPDDKNEPETVVARVELRNDNVIPHLTVQPQPAQKS